MKSNITPNDGKTQDYRIEGRRKKYNSAEVTKTYFLGGSWFVIDDLFFYSKLFI